jgi:hypothetical protein
MGLLQSKPQEEGRQPVPNQKGPEGLTWEAYRCQRDEQNATFEFIERHGLIVMHGAVNHNTEKKLRRILKKHPQVTTLVMTYVPGSDDDDANIDLALFVREKGELTMKKKGSFLLLFSFFVGLTTAIPSRGSVSSGGVDLFLAGKERILCSGARLGVHSWDDDEIGVSGLELQLSVALS